MLHFISAFFIFHQNKIPKFKIPREISCKFSSFVPMGDCFHIFEELIKVSFGFSQLFLSFFLPVLKMRFHVIGNRKLEAERLSVLLFLLTFISPSLFLYLLHLTLYSIFNSFSSPKLSLFQSNFYLPESILFIFNYSFPFVFPFILIALY